MRSILLILLTCVAVSAQEVLLVDKWLQDPIAFKPFFEDFPENGLDLKYRRFHPSLTHSDAERFDAIIVAGGMHPDKPAATYLIPEEAALLTQFVRDGGTFVFLFADHLTDNHVFNTILDSLGIDVRIEAARIEDPLGPKATIYPATHYLNLPRVFVSTDTPLGKGIEGPIAGGRMFSIMVGQTEGIQIPAWTAPSSMRRADDLNSGPRGREGMFVGQARSYPAVLTAKAGKGHVILLPRYLINLNGYTGLATDKPITRPYFLEQNRRFESNLASYIGAIVRGEYEPQELMPLTRLENLNGPTGLPEPDFRFRKRVLDQDAHEQDYETLQPFDEIVPIQPAVLGGQKVRSAHVVVPGLDRAQADCELYAGMGLNLLYVWGARMDKDASGEFGQINDRTAAFLDHCGKAGLKVMIWGYLPATWRWLYDTEYPTTLVDGTGKVYPPPSPLDPDSWDDSLTGVAREYALIAAQFPETVVGTMWDLEVYEHPGLRITEAHGFDNLCFATFIETEEVSLRKAGLFQEAYRIDQARRFGWLESNGLLRSYYRTLEEAVYRMAVRTRKEIDQIHPGLLWGLYTPNIPQSWYYRGVFRGLNRPEDPGIIHITWEARGAQQVSYWKSTLGIDLIHMPAMLMVVPRGDEWQSYLRMCMENEAGYWLFDATALARPQEGWRSRMELQEPPGVIVDQVRRANE